MYILLPYICTCIYMHIIGPLLLTELRVTLFSRGCLCLCIHWRFDLPSWAALVAQLVEHLHGIKYVIGLSLTLDGIFFPWKEKLSSGLLLCFEVAYLQLDLAGQRPCQNLHVPYTTSVGMGAWFHSTANTFHDLGYLAQVLQTIPTRLQYTMQHRPLYDPFTCMHGCRVPSFQYISIIVNNLWIYNLHSSTIWSKIW